jgi:hypothetical protein
MKRCNGCGIKVDDHCKAGDICPGCHKHWNGEYVVQPQIEKSNFLFGNFIWIVLVVFFLLGTLYSLIKDYRYEKIAAGYTEQWMQLETDSLYRVVEDILTYNVEIRRKLFYMTTKQYLKTLNDADLETKIRLIQFTPAIDSIYHSRWPVYNLGRNIYSYGLYLKMVEISNDYKAPPELRQTAIEAVRKISELKPKHYM